MLDGIKAAAVPRFHAADRPTQAAVLAAAEIYRACSIERGLLPGDADA